MPNYYDSIADGYNELHGTEQRRKLNLIAMNLKVKKEDKLLDVGCGTGISFEFFDCDVTGIDPSGELLKKAKGNVVQGFAEQLPFSDGEFDYVICVSALHNFVDPEKAISEMKRVGKDNFVITVFKPSKADLLSELIKKNFKIKNIIEDEHDFIYFCE